MQSCVIIFRRDYSASRDGTHRAIPDALYQLVLDRVEQTDTGLAASLQLARVMRLRGQEVVQCCQSLKTRDKQLEKGAEGLSVIFGTKGGRQRMTQLKEREAVRQIVKEALEITGESNEHLIDKPDLKSAMDYWHNHLRAGGRILSPLPVLCLGAGRDPLLRGAGTEPQRGAGCNLNGSGSMGISEDGISSKFMAKLN